jgi:hypothetical protein
MRKGRRLIPCHSPRLIRSTDRYRRQPHSAALCEYPDDRSNLRIALKNPFGRRHGRASTRNNNDLHVQEAGGADSRTLTPIRIDPQEYRPTTPPGRRHELGIDGEETGITSDGHGYKRQPLRTNWLEAQGIMAPLRSVSAPVMQTEPKGSFESLGITRCDSPTDADAVAKAVPDIAPKTPLNRLPQNNSQTSFDLDVAARSGPTLLAQLRAVLFGSYWNILLLMIPAGVAVKMTLGQPALIFALNFISIIPIGRILSLATKDLVLRLGGLSATAIIMTFG